MRIDSSIKDHKSSTNIMGFYPIGCRHCWHGGIHIEGNLKVCAICDGVVVAYRMPEKYIEVKEEGKPEELAKKYSNGFVLIQHHYKSPKKQELIFYSLYHHLLPQKEYNSEAIPISFRKSIGYKACKGSCKKSGLQMWTGKKRGGDYIFIPNRGIVRKEPIKGDEFTPAEGYCRVVYKVKNEEIIGHVNTKCIASYNDGKLYLINYTKDSATRSNYSNDEKYKCFGVEVWKDKEKKILLDIVDEGTVFNEGKEEGEFIRVKLSEKGKFLIDPEDGCGYIEKKNLESNYEWNAETDKIVNCKIPVKAGDCIGYCGLYTIKDGNYRASHIEVFTDDEKNLEGFLKNTKGDDMEKVEGKEEYEISNAYIKLSGELQQSFTYKLLANTDIVCLDEKGGYYKIKIGSSEQVVCTFPDRKELLKGTNVRYKPLGKGKVTGQYHVLKDITNTNVFGGLLKEGDILDFLETQDQAKANDLDRPSECPRKVRYSYPITGKEFWVNKSCLVSKSIDLTPFVPMIDGIPQMRYPKLPQDESSLEISYALRASEVGGSTIDIELYPEYPENNDLGKIEGEIILPLRECEVFEQGKNQKWYYIKNKNYKDPKGNSLRISGVVNAKEMDIFPAYNWEKFGFSISKQEKDKDTYIFDFDSATPLVKEVWSLVDEDGDKELTADEFRRAVHNKYKVDRLSKLICYHRSEWSYNDAQAWAKLENHIKSCFDKRIQKEKDSSLKAEKEKERDDKLLSYKEKFEKLGFWNEIKIDTSVEKEGETPLSPFPASPYVYHFNPIAFVEHIDRILAKGSCYCQGNLTVELFNKIFGDKTVFAASNMKEINSIYKLDKISFVNAINNVVRKYDINNCLRLAHFLAQIEHESDHFNTTLEYGNGSEYNFREDLGNTKEGDGAKFKGRGLIQLTGKNNYERYTEYVNKEFGETINFAEEPYNELIASDIKYAVDVAGWYWKFGSSWGNINLLADKDDIIKVTKAVNGGTNGLDKRILNTKKAKEVLGYITCFWIDE